MTKIKICGLTTPQDAQTVNSVKADFAGIVLFFPKSRRNLSVTQAASVLFALNPSVSSVAVTVSPTPSQAAEIQSLGFDYIQIHGELSAETLQVLTIPILRAFNMSDTTQYDRSRQNEKIAGYVFDAQTPGSGKTFDWSLVKPVRDCRKPWLLAGGLHSCNVADAIRTLHPWGVDVSSGVETAGISGKDPSKIHAFVQAVREADQLLSREN